jgi:hypothetical protein
MLRKAASPHLAVSLAPSHLDPWQAVLAAASELRASGIPIDDTPFAKPERRA